MIAFYHEADKVFQGVPENLNLKIMHENLEHYLDIAYPYCKVVFSIMTIENATYL